VIRESQSWIGGRQTRYLEAGAGWPLILLHAFPLNADMWRPQLERVPDGWRFIAPDLHGFGPGQPDVEPATLDDVADELCQFINELKLDQVVLCGLSMGGYLAFAAWRKFAESISALVLADTRPQPDSPEGREGRRAMMTLADTGGVAAVADQMLPKLLGVTTRRDRPDVEPQVRRIIESNSASAVKGALHALMTRPDSSPDLPRIAMPVLVMVGDEDAITPVDVSQEMQRALPRSRLVVLSGAGHLSSLESPVAFSTALADFLSSTL
jgi:pimeloyl-ACP methyl ester carboxylesterase